MMRTLCICAVAVITSSAGCGGQRAALNQTSLRSSQCGPNDAACRDRGLSAPIAVGATFRPDVDFRVPGAGGSSFQFIAAQPRLLSVVGHALKANAPGTTAVLMSTGDTVVDFIHLTTKAVDEIKLIRLSKDASERGLLHGRIGLIEGESLNLRPVAYGDGQRLAGHADATWTTSSSSVEILRDGTPHRRRLVARTSGPATVTVSLLGKQATLHIDVVKGAAR